MGKITEDEIRSAIEERLKNFEMPMPTIVPIEQTEDDKEDRALSIRLGYSKEHIEQMQEAIRKDVFNLLINNKNIPNK